MVSTMLVSNMVPKMVIVVKKISSKSFVSTKVSCYTLVLIFFYNGVKTYE